MGGRLRRVAVVSRDPVLRRFWISQMVSEMGDWIGLLGIAALLYAHTDLALAASASLAALYLPYLFAPLLVGWTAKIPPRTLLIGADVLRAGLILLLLVPGLPAWALLAIVFLASVPTSVYEATRAAAVPEYAPDEETREDALVLFQSTQQAATMLGFLVGGAALALVGLRCCHRAERGVVPHLRDPAARRAEPGAARRRGRDGARAAAQRGEGPRRTPDPASRSAAVGDQREHDHGRRGAGRRVCHQAGLIPGTPGHSRH